LLYANGFIWHVNINLGDGKAQVLLFVISALHSVRIFENREDFGVRWQSAAATPLFDCGQSFQSGVALRFPPQSKFFWLRLRRAVFFCG
jgi:hypothetical protein